MAGNGTKAKATAGKEREVTETLDTVKVTLPLKGSRGGYSRRHIDLQLTRERADTLQRLADGLIFEGAELTGGRKVTSGADALRWVLDGLAQASETSAD